EDVVAVDHRERGARGHAGVARTGPAAGLEGGPRVVRARGGHGVGRAGIRAAHVGRGGGGRTGVAHARVRARCVGRGGVEFVRGEGARVAGRARGVGARRGVGGRVARVGGHAVGVGAGAVRRAARAEGQGGAEAEGRGGDEDAGSRGRHRVPFT